jgi:protein-S-isoprenylcysteine O-methyltransferase Ste14
MNSLFARAVLAFVALPGVVAFAIPLWMLRRADRGWSLPGVAVVTVGTLILLRCVRDFYVAGRGTLAPWSPPQHLVTVGLYRWSRNPMYVGVMTILIGWAVTFRSRSHLTYAVVVAVVFHLRVVLFEEPWLAARYGEAWQRYRAAVPRWLLW